MNDASLGQFFTPAWAAELLVRRHFPDLGAGDTVLEPSCGDGRFLMAIPSNVDAFGVEIDPVQAAAAVRNSGREAAADLFEFGDEQYVPAAKWLNERAEELEREPALIRRGHHSGHRRPVRRIPPPGMARPPV